MSTWCSFRTRHVVRARACETNAVLGHAAPEVAAAGFSLIKFENMADGTVRVEIREIVLTDEASVHTDGERTFIAMEAPPPVRSVVALHQEDGSVTSLEVREVVEVGDSDPRGTCGCYGVEVDADALARAARVGTEGLAGQPVATPTETPAPLATPSAGAATDTEDVQMGMPAPVVEPDESDTIDVESREAAAGGGASDEGETEDDEDTEDDEAPVGDDNATQTPRRRRRGRKQR